MPDVASKFGFLARAGVFVLIAILGMIIFPPLMMPVAGYFVTAALGTFAAAAVANALALRIYERGQLIDIGLGWTAASRKNLALGVLGGVGAALFVVGVPVAAGMAHVEHTGDGRFHLPSVLFVSVVLLFGAVGEEMLFRGYAFQVLARSLGEFATVLPMGVLFGIAHLNNQNVTALGIINTMGWGVLLGVAFLRSGDLWLPIGIHFGWNWVLPLTGANLSGFTMDVTGRALRSELGPLWSGGAYGPEGGLLTSVVVVALFFFLQRAPISRQEAFLLARDEDASGHDGGPAGRLPHSRGLG